MKTAKDDRNDHEHGNTPKHECCCCQPHDQSESRDHVGGNKTVGDAFADLKRDGPIDKIGHKSVRISSERFFERLGEEILGNFGII